MNIEYDFNQECSITDLTLKSPEIYSDAEKANGNATLRGKSTNFLFLK